MKPMSNQHRRITGEDKGFTAQSPQRWLVFEISAKVRKKFARKGSESATEQKVTLA
jgi:hypothetical protein